MRATAARCASERRSDAVGAAALWQEGKALRLLATHGVSASEASTLIAAFCQRVPALAKASPQSAA